MIKSEFIKVSNEDYLQWKTTTNGKQAQNMNIETKNDQIKFNPLGIPKYIAHMTEGKNHWKS
jgi:hypothetical protein